MNRNSPTTSHNRHKASAAEAVAAAVAAAKASPLSFPQSFIVE